MDISTDNSYLIQSVIRCRRVTLSAFKSKLSLSFLSQCLDHKLCSKHGLDYVIYVCMCDLGFKCMERSAKSATREDVRGS